MLSIFEGYVGLGMHVSAACHIAWSVARLRWPPRRRYIRCGAHVPDLLRRSFILLGLSQAFPLPRFHFLVTPFSDCGSLLRLLLLLLADFNLGNCFGNQLLRGCQFVLHSCHFIEDLLQLYLVRDNVVQVILELTMASRGNRNTHSHRLIHCFVTAMLGFASAWLAYFACTSCGEQGWIHIDVTWRQRLNERTHIWLFFFWWRLLLRL